VADAPAARGEPTLSGPYPRAMGGSNHQLLPSFPVVQYEANAPYK
jgi:hypothetical protein